MTTKKARDVYVVGVGPGPWCAGTIVQACVLAERNRARLVALHVETTGSAFMNRNSREGLERNLALASARGAELVILKGDNAARTLCDFARLRSAAKLILGKPGSPSLGSFFRRGVGDQVWRHAGGLEVRVVEPEEGRKPPLGPKPRSEGLSWQKFLWSAVFVAVFTVLALGFNGLGIADASIVLTLLMSVVICGWIFGFVYSVFASVLAVLSHSFFFSDPIYSFEVSDPQHYLAFLFMSVVGLLISTLAARLQNQTNLARSREGKLETLHRFSRELSRKIDLSEVVETSEAALQELLQTPVRVFMAGREGWESSSLPDRQKSLFAQVLQKAEKAGWTTAVDPDAGSLVLPLHGSSGILGLLCVSRPEDPAVAAAFPLERLSLAETLGTTVGLALDRVELIQASRKTALKAETEKTRSVLLHGISHDLRTPLTVISATASALLSAPGDESDRRVRLESIKLETEALIRQVVNVLELTSLTTGTPKPKREWLPAEDIVFACLERWRDLFPEAEVKCLLPESLSLCFADAPLIERALMNLLENAAVYGGGSGIEVELSRDGNWIRFAVKDRGPGVAEDEKALIFQKFVRGAAAKGAVALRGSGLGLAIVQAVVRLHRGRAGVGDRPGGGTEFWFQIPLPKEKPPLPEDEA